VDSGGGGEHHRGWQDPGGTLSDVAIKAGTDGKGDILRLLEAQRGSIAVDGLPPYRRRAHLAAGARFNLER